MYQPNIRNMTLTIYWYYELEICWYFLHQFWFALLWYLGIVIDLICIQIHTSKSSFIKGNSKPYLLLLKGTRNPSPISSLITQANIFLNLPKKIKKKKSCQLTHGGIRLQDCYWLNFGYARRKFCTQPGNCQFV